ncbi:OmpA family protein [uncultured Thiocystis sp.]|jgi:OOP family OmpA-OmpF porin|uniref:OmpA family protein n=1 Tax=uncultured Thiocystis sp. TaxID=1202134 RepID=UPI0025ED98CF|nr:OmpA family protein [uncultured Thiocystis sp.]
MGDPPPSPGGHDNRGFVPHPIRLDIYVLFDFDQDQPNTDGRIQVEELAKALQSGEAGQRYRLTGHTDSKGPADYNQKLSERRADSVRSLVVSHYPALSGHILIAGRGKSELKYPDNTEEDHRLNRRVELEVIGNP